MGTTRLLFLGCATLNQPVHAFAGSDKPDPAQSAYTALCGASITSKLVPIYEQLLSEYWAYNQPAAVLHLIECPGCQAELSKCWKQLRAGENQAPLPAAPEAPSEPASAANAGPALICTHCAAEYYLRPGHRAQIKKYCSERCSAVARVQKRHAMRKENALLAQPHH